MKKIIFLGIILVVLACEKDQSSFTPLNKMLSVETDKSEYTTSDTVKFYIRNNSDEIAYVKYCGDLLIYGIQKKERDDWKHYYWTICLARYATVNAELSPGSKISSSRNFHVPGVYQIVVPFQTTEGEAVADTLVSNVFTILP